MLTREIRGAERPESPIDDPIGMKSFFLFIGVGPSFSVIQGEFEIFRLIKSIYLLHLLSTRYLFIENDFFQLGTMFI